MGLSVLLSCCELILGVTFELLQGHEALSPVEGDIGVFANGSSTPGVPLKFQGENGLLLRCSGKVGIHTHVSILPQFPSHLGCHMKPRRGPCALQEDVVGYLF